MYVLYVVYVVYVVMGLLKWGGEVREVIGIYRGL